jgi:EmrB/QacA subfamily drug resistance transporter
MNNSEYKRPVLIAGALITFIASFMSSSINIALPAIGRELQMDAVLLSWVPTSFILAAATFLLPFGRLADIYGRKRILTYGISIFIISSVLLFFVPSATLLIALRSLQGIGGAMIFANNIAIVTSVFPVRERGKALGIIVAMVYLGLSLGPTLGGLITHNFGWRYIFLVGVPVGIAVIATILHRVKGEWADARDENFNLSSSMAYGISLVGLIYGLSLLPAGPGILLTIAGLLGLFVFVKRETKVENPILDVNLFRKNKVFAFSNIAAFLNYSATFAVAFYLSLYLQYIKGLSPQNAGFILIAMPAVQAIFSPIAGRLSDRVEPRILASLGMGLTAIGLSLFIALNENTELGFIITGLIIVGFGFALFSSPNANAIMSSITQRFYGVASAMVATMRTIGMMFSMSIAILLFSIYVGRVEITPVYYPQFLITVKIAFSIFTALCSAGIFASLVRDKR